MRVLQLSLEPVAHNEHMLSVIISLLSEGVNYKHRKDAGEPTATS